MLTAKEYAALSASVGGVALKVKPEDASPVAQSANLAVYHLRCAAKELQKLAEWKAEHEGKAATA